MKFMNKSVALLLVIIHICGSVFCGCGTETTDKKETTETKVAETKATDVTKTAAEEGSCRMYDYLTEREKKVYDAACKALAEYDYKLEVEIKDQKNLDASMQKALDAMWCDNPQFFWLDNNNYWIEDGDTVIAYLGYFEYWGDEYNKEDVFNAVNDKADDIVKKAEKYPTEIEKIKFVHDYLVENVTYLNSAVKDEENVEVSSQHSRSAYGALMKNSAVCCGYSRAFQLVMQKLNIRCGYIEGMAGKELHAWNFLNVDGEYYWMDVTWDDTDKDDVIYEYYNVNDDIFLVDHKPENDIFVPECTSSKYVKREGVFLGNYDYETFRAEVINQKDKDVIIVSFKNGEEVQKLEDDLYGENQRYKEIEEITGMSNLTAERLGISGSVKLYSGE